MPNLTQNLGLKKPLLNETADIDVLNENFDKIDAEIGNMPKKDGTLQAGLNAEKVGGKKVDELAPASHTHTKNEITNLSNELNKNLLYYDSIKGTTQYPTFDESGNITKIEHKDAQNNVIRTDTFGYYLLANLLQMIIEKRTLNTGEVLTLKHYFDANENYLRTEVI